MKRLICLLLSFTLLLSVAGCGSDSGSSTKKRHKVSVDDYDDSVFQVQAPQIPPRDQWLNDHNVTISPQGEFSTKTEVQDEEVEVYSSISITESTEGCPDGFKKITANFITLDGSSNKRYWYSAFDRYTGCSFEYDTTTVTSTSSGSVKTRLSLELNMDIDILFDFSDKTNAKVTITCPESYDGTVFYAGYASRDLMTAYDKFDFENGNVYKADELPYWGSEYRFFTYTND